MASSGSVPHRAPPAFRGSRDLGKSSHSSHLHKDVKPFHAPELGAGAPRLFAGYAAGDRVTALVPSHGGAVAGTVLGPAPSSHVPRAHRRHAALAPFAALPSFLVQINGDAEPLVLTSAQLHLLAPGPLELPFTEPPAAPRGRSRRSRGGRGAQRRRVGALLRATVSEGEGEAADDEAEAEAEAEAADEDEDNGGEMLLRAATAVAAALAAEAEFEGPSPPAAGGAPAPSPRASFHELHSKRAAALADAMGRHGAAGRWPSRPRHSHKRAGRFSLKRAAAEAEADDVGGPSAWKSDTGVSAAPRRRALFAAASNAFASGPAAAGGGSGGGGATPPGGGGDALGEDAATSTASTATVASSGPKSTLSAS